MNRNNKNYTNQNISLQVIPRQEHDISRKDIDSNALKVLTRLDKAGFEAYLVGGCVRDILLNRQPKDFDIATNATPEQVQKLFRNCRLIGRRFRLAHILFGREIIEVATLRGHHDENQSNDGRLLRDNVYGSIDEDAQRRDFTVNSIYYNIKDFSIRDYAGGLDDLDDGIIRLIGDPKTRYREDPVRMLRAIRFAVKLDMQIESATAAPIAELSYLLKDIPSARLFEETLKLLQSGEGFETYHMLREFKLFSPLFPQLSEHFSEEGNTKCERMIERALDSTDYRIANDMRVNPAFLFAAMLWYPLETRAEEITFESGLNYYDAIMIAANDLLDEQVKTIAIPRRHTATIREIWQLQLRLPRRSGNRAFKLLEQPKFRAAFDLLKMRAEIEGGQLVELASWWESFQHSNTEAQVKMIKTINNESPASKSRRHKRKYSRNKNSKR